MKINSIMKAGRMVVGSIAAFACLSWGVTANAQADSPTAANVAVTEAAGMILAEKYVALERENGELAEKLLLLEASHKELQAKEQELRKKLLDLNSAGRRFSRKLSQRTFRNVSRHVAGMPGSAIPYVGAGVQVGMTRLDVRDGCDTLEELNEMIRAMGEETVDASRVCEIKVPTMEEVLAQVISNWRTAYAVAAAWSNQYEIRLPPEPPTVPHAGANELWIAVFGTSHMAAPPALPPGLISPRSPTPPVPPVPPVAPTMLRPG